MTRRWRLIGSCAAIVTGSGVAGAQAWTAQLVLSPAPSAFVSDWEVDPTIAELIVTNGTATATNVTFHYTLARGTQVVVRGVTDPHMVPANQSKVFNAASTFGGKADWNREMQDLVTRTGRIPEGDYEACVALADPGGAVLVERECVRFTVAYPDAPFLVYPMNGDTIRSQAPMFEWQPVQVPAMADARIAYVLQIAEVSAMARQSPEVALSSNILHYAEPNLVETSHQYPVGALPLVSGRTYAWRVQALDGTGKPIASNQGRSEIWTFVYREPESEAQRTVARVELTASRDTLRFAGDTVRYLARAYDADNVEIVGRTAQWRALDTTIARIDSTGVVTAARIGQARIVASIDGVADSASTIIAPRQLAVRFESYDAATESPSLIELIKSGSFDEVVPALMARLEAGEFVIPIPRHPDATSSGSGPGDTGAEAAIDDGSSPGGPFAGLITNAGAAYSARGTECSVAIQGATASLNRVKKVFTVLLNNPSTTGVLQQCKAVPESAEDSAEPNESTDETTTTSVPFNRSLLFVVSWEHPGLPRAFVAWKGAGGLPIPIGGTRVVVRYAVLNLIRAVEVGSEMLPDTLARYFGDDSFDAGIGITLYSKRSCPAQSEMVPRVVLPEESVPERIGGAWADARDQGMLCYVLRTLHPETPEITTVAFLGRTAAETSVGFGGGRDVSKSVGVSRAFGFSIHSTLPVRKYSNDGSGVRIDSTQVGLLFAIQDSLTTTVQRTVTEGPERDTSAVRGKFAQGWSVGVSPTLSIWLTGSKDRQWQVDGSVGLEWDPSNIVSGEAHAWAPKLVVSGVLQATWMLGPVRLGSPQFVFTTPLGQLTGQREATTLALSGAWGLGEPGEIGLVENDGGSQPTDAGSSRSALKGFEELGRGQVTLEWTQMTAANLAQENRRVAAAGDTTRAKQERDSATARLARKQQEYDAAKKRLETATAKLDTATKTATLGQKEERRDTRRTDPAPTQAGAPGTLAPPVPRSALLVAKDEHAAADKAVKRLEAELEALRQARADARDALRPRKCLANIKNRCLTWKASLSLQSGALTELIVAAGRFLGELATGAIK